MEQNSKVRGKKRFLVIGTLIVIAIIAALAVALLTGLLTGLSAERVDLEGGARAGSEETTATPQPQADDVRMINGINFVYIPSGSFIMGADDGDDDEKPPHSMSVDSFWMMQTEVTKAQYKRCIADGVCTDPDDRRVDDAAFANHPVVGVDWYQARTYAEWIGGRLPSEAEWEYACHGADGRTYPWGSEAPSFELLNFGFNIRDTTDVSRYPAGANGLRDMAGNVWEWTSSHYAAYPYEADDGREDGGGDDGHDDDGDEARTLRGGSFRFSSSLVRCANRNKNSPDNSGIGGGIRVVLSALEGSR